MEGRNTARPQSYLLSMEPRCGRSGRQRRGRRNICPDQCEARTRGRSSPNDFPVYGSRQPNFFLAQPPYPHHPHYNHAQPVVDFHHPNYVRPHSFVTPAQHRYAPRPRQHPGQTVDQEILQADVSLLVRLVRNSETTSIRRSTHVFNALKTIRTQLEFIASSLKLSQTSNVLDCEHVNLKASEIEKSEHVPLAGIYKCCLQCLNSLSCPVDASMSGAPQNPSS